MIRSRLLLPLRSRAAVALLWALVIAVLLVVPLPGPKSGGGWFDWFNWFGALEEAGADKLVHLALFAVQAFLSYRWLRSAGVSSPGAWTLVATVVYGALTEILQVPIPDRHGDLRDLAADGLGALLGTMLAFRWRRGR